MLERIVGWISGATGDDAAHAAENMRDWWPTIHNAIGLLCLAGLTVGGIAWLVEAVRNRHPMKKTLKRPLAPGAVDQLFANLDVPTDRKAPSPQTAPPPRKPTRLESALDDKTEFDFFDQPLSDVIEYVKAMHDIEVQLDGKALEDAGIGSDTTITLSIKGVTLATALDLALRSLDMTYVTQGEILMITSRFAAREMVSPQVYQVDDLVSGSDFRTLISAIKCSVTPRDWDDEGGPGNILTHNKSLVILQTQEAHREIASLLKSMREAQP